MFAMSIEEKTFVLSKNKFRLFFPQLILLRVINAASTLI